MNFPYGVSSPDGTPNTFPQPDTTFEAYDGADRTLAWLTPNLPEPWYFDPKAAETEIEDPLTRLTHHEHFEDLREEITGAARLPDDIWECLVLLRRHQNWKASRILIVGRIPSTSRLDHIWESMPTRAEHKDPNDWSRADVDMHQQCTSSSKQSVAIETLKGSTEGSLAETTRRSKRRRAMAAPGPFICPHAPKCQGKTWKKFGMFRRHLLSDHDVKVTETECQAQTKYSPAVAWNGGNVYSGLSE